MSGTKRHLRRLVKKSLAGAYALHYYHRLRAAALSTLSDEAFAKRSYGRPLDLEDPKTFDERLWWLKLHYRNPLMVQCTDKVAVREYVRSKGLGNLLMPLVGDYARPEDIPWSSLPESFYLKTNNSSATNIRCDRREHFDVRRAERLLKLYLRRDHYALSREWNYRDIKPRILIEPVLDDGGSGLIDYRFFCSYGVCNGIFVDVDTAATDGTHRADARRNVYDLDWNLLNVRVTRPRILDKEIERPPALDSMISYAKTLSEPFPLCRVDFYNPKDEQVVFGEMTFFHGGGNNHITPERYQYVLGGWIDIERAVREVEEQAPR